MIIKLKKVLITRIWLELTARTLYILFRLSSSQDIVTAIQNRGFETRLKQNIFSIFLWFIIPQKFTKNNAYLR